MLDTKDSLRLKQQPYLLSCMLCDTIKQQLLLHLILIFLKIKLFRSWH